MVVCVLGEPNMVIWAAAQISYKSNLKKTGPILQRITLVLAGLHTLGWDCTIQQLCQGNTIVRRGYSRISYQP